MLGSLWEAATLVGEMVADGLGITESRYQNVIDAYDRFHKQIAEEKYFMKKKQQERSGAEPLQYAMSPDDVPPPCTSPQLPPSLENI